MTQHALLVFCALLKISQTNCDNNECTSKDTATLTTNTTAVKFEPQPNCTLSIGNDSSGQGLITGLTPGAIYPIFLRCLNCCKEVTTKPEAVSILRVTETTTSLYLTWTEPVGNSSLYRVQWTDGKENKTAETTETSKNITGLTPGVKYTLYVTAVADDSSTEGEKGYISWYTKPDVVRNLTVGQVTTSSISLMWAEPEGESSFYRVQWTNGRTNWNISVTETNINITELTAGVQYNFTVIAVAGDNTTESAMAETFHFTKPQVVSNLSVLNVTTSSMFLTWTEPEGQRSLFTCE
uniref:receptor-type tyrosine-protein phosphatase eta-like n=1 Tax=Semicossyphus pulcher TaxID=241346 RepID=UPI0037E9B865